MLHSGLQNRGHGTECTLPYVIKRQILFGEHGKRSTIKTKEVLHLLLMAARQMLLLLNADCFRQTFHQNSVPNNRAKVNELSERFTAKYQEYEANHDISCDCKSKYISPLIVIDALGSLKCNKSADDNGITAEHFHFAPLSLLL